MVMLPVVESEKGCTFMVRVVPRGRRDEIVGLHGDALKLRLAAPPERGKANRALRKFLAKRLDVSPADVEIISGYTSRQKRVCVRDVSVDSVRALVSAK